LTARLAPKRRRPAVTVASLRWRATGSLITTGREAWSQLVWLGELLVFIIRAFVAIPYVLRHHRQDVWTNIAEVAFGSGVLSVLASTIAVSAIMASSLGVQIGLEGLQSLNLIGLAPLAGLLASFGDTRELAPLITAFGLAAQMGCKFTAQLGAMRVTEEIDALEVMSVPPLPFLISTRLIAALVVVGPLYLFSLSGAYLASQITIISIAHQGTGTYQHYFYLFLSRRDVIYSVIKVVVFAIMITIIHCYYGYTATGGPEGVGRAAGRAIRASIVGIAVLDMLTTLLFWGLSSPIKISG
jgi:phospholipid/cholesterol/gamma-HCH transport system permease protein